jgi:glycosyltransferase involved in cell wall biosynthesis
MRIGINLLYLLPGIVGGTETYADGLLREFAASGSSDEFVIFVNQESIDWPLPQAANFHRVVCPVRAISRFDRYLYEQLRLPRLLAEHRIDVVHSLGYVTPFRTPCPSVVSILDIVYDYPGAFPFAKKQLLKALVAGSARFSDHIITISGASQKQIVARLNVPADKVTVTLLAHKERPATDDSDWANLCETLGITHEYALAFSSLSPSKNIPMLLQAFAKIKADSDAPAQLVLVGHRPKRGVVLDELVRSLGLGSSVVFTGYLSDRQLSLLLHQALAFVFPSLYEGFGIPVLEAMAAGVPVACSDAASLPEVAGDAAVFFDPRSRDQMAAQLQRLIVDAELRASLIRHGLQNVRRFSWAQTAKQTLDVYHRVASRT